MLVMFEGKKYYNYLLVNMTLETFFFIVLVSVKKLLTL